MNAAKISRETIFETEKMRIEEALKGEAYYPQNNAFKIN